MIKVMVRAMIKVVVKLITYGGDLISYACVYAIRLIEETRERVGPVRMWWRRQLTARPIMKTYCGELWLRLL